MGKTIHVVGDRFIGSSSDTTAFAASRSFGSRLAIETSKEGNTIVVGAGNLPGRSAPPGMNPSFICMDRDHGSNWMADQLSPASQRFILSILYCLLYLVLYYIFVLFILFVFLLCLLLFHLYILFLFIPLFYLYCSWILYLSALYIL